MKQSGLFCALILIATSTATLNSRFITGKDPCAVIGTQKWATPKEVRDCLKSFEVEKEVKDNIIEVINKTLAFHTSVNYQIQVPPPFANDVHEDVMADIARIREEKYQSDFDLHIDLSRALKRLNDGHCVWINRCYDAVFVSYLPTPLVLLTDKHGDQHVYIAPEAFNVSSAEFGEDIEFWQNALPHGLKGELESFSGAKVLQIDGKEPFAAVDANALITGGYQSFGTRQNSFFSSYSVARSGVWIYSMGNFAQQALPLNDFVTMTVHRPIDEFPIELTLPYRARFGSSAKNFTDSVSFKENNCKARTFTNGQDIYSNDAFSVSSVEELPITAFEQQQPVNIADRKKHSLNVILDNAPLSDVDLPSNLRPSLPSLNESYSVAQFYMLQDGKTGVLALGSFSAENFDLFQKGLLSGLLALKWKGADRLIVDVTNNGGGFICIAHWLHRILVGPKSSTVPGAGLDTKVRAGPLAQLIVKQIKAGADLKSELSYNPTNWRNENNDPFEERSDWLKPHAHVEINGRKDVFSQRIGQECQPFSITAPPERLFDPKKTLIVSNGRCASSCSLFSITMSKHEGARTVVLGGKKNVRQQYCGVVGGQSTDFSMIDTEIKSVKLKNHTLAPPDLLSNGIMGITWRLGFGIDNPFEPEEWQDHPADINFPLTLENVNNPVAIWEELAQQYLSEGQISSDFVDQSESWWEV